MTSAAARAEVHTGDSDELTLGRVLAAPREHVFAAFTDPRHIAAWWGGGRFRTTVEKMDPRPGGRVVLHLHAADGKVHVARGVYEEVLVPERIVLLGEGNDEHPCGAGLPPGGRVTISLREVDGGTEVTVHTRFASAAARTAASTAGFDSGWQASLEALVRHIPAA